MQTKNHVMKKKIIVLLLFVSLVSCVTNNESRKKESMTIRCYKSGSNKINEQIEVEQIVKNAMDKMFIYKYKNLKEDYDTLHILNNNVLINRVNLSYISKKAYKCEDKKIEIKKYLLESNYSSIDIFLNDSLGLILTNTVTSTSNSIITEFNVNTNMDEIIKQIIDDKKFFYSDSIIFHGNIPD